MKTLLIASTLLLLTGCSSDVEWGDRGARFDAPINWRGSASITQDGDDDIIDDPCAPQKPVNMRDLLRVYRALKDFEREVEPPQNEEPEPEPEPVAGNGFPPPTSSEHVACAVPKKRCRKFLFWRVPCGEC